MHTYMSHTLNNLKKFSAHLCGAHVGLLTLPNSFRGGKNGGEQDGVHPNPRSTALNRG